MRTVVDCLAAKVSAKGRQNSGNIELRLNSVVTKLHVPDNGDGEILVKDELSGNETGVYCSRVVITIPPPAMKPKGLSIVPPIPDWKIGALNSITFGVYTKLILYFKEESRFWPDLAPSSWALCWHEDSEIGNVRYVENYYRMKKVPALVVVFGK